MKKIRLVLLITILFSITTIANAGEVKKGIRVRDIPGIVHDGLADIYHSFGTHQSSQWPREKENRRRRGPLTDKERSYYKWGIEQLAEPSPDDIDTQYGAQNDRMFLETINNEQWEMQDPQKELIQPVANSSLTTDELTAYMIEKGLWREHYWYFYPKDTSKERYPRHAYAYREYPFHSLTDRILVPLKHYFHYLDRKHNLAPFGEYPFYSAGHRYYQYFPVAGESYWPREYEYSDGSPFSSEDHTFLKDTESDAKEWVLEIYDTTNTSNLSKEELLKLAAEGKSISSTLLNKIVTDEKLPGKVIYVDELLGDE